MGIINLLRALLPLFKDSKTFVGTIACSALLGQWMMGYVDKKHHEGIQAIQITQTQVADMKLREYQSQISLSSIEQNMNSMAERMKVMDQRIWELYRDSKQSRIVQEYRPE